MRVISILYHDVVPSADFGSSGFLDPGANRYKLDLQDFSRHLQAIAQHIPRVPLTISQLPPHLEDRSLLLTFDDGGVSAYTLIADALESHGWRGHFFVTTNFVDTPRFLSRGQIRELRGRGHVIGSHSASHPMPISACPPRQLDKEWSDSIRTLQDILGEPVQLASIPGGFYSRQVAESAARVGIRLLFTSEPRLTPWRVADLHIFGRFGIWRGTPPQVAAELAAGKWQPRTKQFLSWKCKGILKYLSGSSYEKLRNRFLAE